MSTQKLCTMENFERSQSPIGENNQDAECTKCYYMHQLVVVFQIRAWLTRMLVQSIYAYLAFINSNNPDAALPLTTLLVKSLPLSAILFICPFSGLDSGVSTPSRSKAVRGGNGVTEMDRGGEDETGAVMKREEKAVGSNTGGGRSIETGPPVIVIFAGAASIECLALFGPCEWLTWRIISSSSSLEFSRWTGSMCGRARLEKGR
jgi:hypothetical protein